MVKIDNISLCAKEEYNLSYGIYTLVIIDPTAYYNFKEMGIFLGLVKS
jgi:hypothetical protein